MERGDRPIGVEHAIRLGQFFGVDWTRFIESAPPPLLSSAELERIRSDVDVYDEYQGMQRVRAIPVVAKAHAGPANLDGLLADPIDWIPCLPGVRAPRAYAVQVMGRSMAPRYRPGQLLYLNPDKVARAEDGVVVVTADGSVLIKEFVRWRDDRPRDDGCRSIVVRELNPSEREIEIDDAAEIHVVVGSREYA